MYRPREIAAELGISPSTLRLWSTRFAPLLSDGARKDDAGPTAQRRYDDADLQTLRRVQDLLKQGQTYSQVADALTPKQAPPNHQSPQPPQTGAAVAPIPVEVSADNALAAFHDTLEAKDAVIATLRDSLAFMDVYLKTALQDRDAARADQASLMREIDTIKAINQRLALRLQRPWWKRLLAIE